ncbi:ATP-binding protein [Jeotgalibaca sp. MA1X17-3]|uniref:AAA family ATPase n=1 Tax=Jeotgalibaca sp. MA1X17-3 TaxID=2908211 RepID=UPI001F2988FC|nr:AAA family ATPase [Jeotgalibaca sp. MA1X17-3]UJF14689.1 ATP-binding protein [Jeotgalibaca sp. MA1X17-3]
MIKEIQFNTYRKLKDINLIFSPYLNIISGSNGTCKSSIIHIVSNSFQRLTTTDEKVNDKNSLKVINQLNKLTNPKIESLTRGDKEYNDPAYGVTGELYNCTYLNDYSLSFRRHNSSTETKRRFAVKPEYRPDSGDSLPKIPIIYLGLFRLFSFGEFDSDELIKKLANTLPKEYIEEIQKMYFDFTGYNIDVITMFSMGAIKNRPDFSTDKTGIDSNTISAGEDNLFIIILALISLKYYYESINSNQEVESILLIDEFDATLHPSFQNKLFDIITKYSKEFHIQVLFTSHSLSLIEHSLKTPSTTNIIYLIDNIFKVTPMLDPDIYKIERHLKEITQEESYVDNLIPIFTEDEEARSFLKILFSHYENVTDINISKFFHLVDANFSSETIKNIANDTILLKSTLRSINILDGDQSSQNNLNNQLITLPGSESPETLLFKHAEKLLRSEDTRFWDNEVLVKTGYSRTHFRNNISNKINEIEERLSASQVDGKSTRGMRRESNKRIFNEHIHFWRFVTTDWINDSENYSEVYNFFKNLNICFKKAAEFHGVSSNDWINNYVQD